jgi:PIN domain nuclease of toxin-antitoxin system
LTERYLADACAIVAFFLAEHGFKMLPLTWDNAESANKLPPIHQDPMDRMLIAQALDNGLTIITEDAVIPHYGVKTIW